MSKTPLAVLALVLGCGSQMVLAQSNQSNASTTASPDSSVHKKHHAKSRPALGATKYSNRSGPGIGSGVDGEAGGPGGAGTSGTSDGFGGAVGVGGRR